MFGFGNGNGGNNGGRRQRYDKKGRPVRSVPLINFNGSEVMSGIFKDGNKSFAIVVKPSNDGKQDRKGNTIVAWVDIKDLGLNRYNNNRY